MGKHTRDLLGQRFGKLTAIEFLGLREMCGQRMAYWLCQCDCGNTCEVAAHYLLAKKFPKTHCGCVKRPGRKPKPPAYSLVGEVFGDLTVTGFAGRDKIGNYCWHCDCVCGNKTIASTTALQTGTKKSCGCRYSIPNRYYFIENVGICLINNGEEYFWFDIEDIDLVLAHQWSTHQGYAYTHDYENSTTQRFTRLLLNLQDPDIFVDHINGDVRDNRRCNLRTCTPEQNCQHRSKVRGWHPTLDGTGKFFAQIQVGGKVKRLGRYSTPEEARRAYQKAAIECYGEDFAPYEKIIWFPGCDEHPQDFHDFLIEWMNFLVRRNRQDGSLRG